MKDQFMTLTFWIEIVIAFIIAIVIYIAAKVYNPVAKQKEVKVDYFRVPTNNALVVISLLVPISVSLVSYLYINDPNGKYASLLAAIVIMFLVLVVAIWETFALLKMAQNGDIITVKIPEDRRYIVGMGLMYSFLLLGLVYFSIFFLFEIAPAGKTKNDAISTGSSTYSLLKPRAYIDQSKDDLLKIWGQPAAEDIPNRKLSYESEYSVLQLNFDENQKLSEIVEKRR